VNIDLASCRDFLVDKIHRPRDIFPAGMSEVDCRKVKLFDSKPGVFSAETGKFLASVHDSRHAQRAQPFQV
jgi:hypothetical protein